MARTFSTQSGKKQMFVGPLVEEEAPEAQLSGARSRLILSVSWRWAGHNRDTHSAQSYIRCYFHWYPQGDSNLYYRRERAVITGSLTGG
jgi:hypothetical protein